MPTPWLLSLLLNLTWLVSLAWIYLARRYEYLVTSLITQIIHKFSLDAQGGRNIAIFWVEPEDVYTVTGYHASHSNLRNKRRGLNLWTIIFADYILLYLGYLGYLGLSRLSCFADCNPAVRNIQQILEVRRYRGTRILQGGIYITGTFCYSLPHHDWYF